MRTTVALLGSFALSTAVAGAQECAAPPAVCAPPTCAPRVGAPHVGAPTERFLRVPAPGATAGESNSLGIRGPTLHIPEIRISLPQIELPSLYHVRHDATKFFGPTQSPLVGEPALEFDNVGAAPEAPKVGAPPPTHCVPACPPACAAPGCHASLDAQLKELEDKLARIEALQARISQLQSLPPQPPRIPTATTSGSTKPVVASRTASGPASSRPIPRTAPPKYQTAAYEEAAEPLAVPVRRIPATSAHRPLPSPPRAAMGLSKPLATSTADFGDWNAER